MNNEIKKTDCEPINLDLVNKIKPNMPDLNLLYELSDFFKVMGDGTRIQLLWALEQSEMCVGDLAVLLNMTKSAVSHQLKVLRTAKLVRAHKNGKNVYYALNDSHVKDIFERKTHRFPSLWHWVLRTRRASLIPLNAAGTCSPLTSFATLPNKS